MTTYRDWDKAQSNVISYKRAYDISQQALEVVLRENRVRAECLKIAMKMLLGQAINTQEIVAQIEARLAELKPKETG